MPASPVNLISVRSLSASADISLGLLLQKGLFLASSGNIIIALKTPYDDGTAHVVLSPMEFIGRRLTGCASMSFHRNPQELRYFSETEKRVVIRLVRLEGQKL